MVEDTKGSNSWMGLKKIIIINDNDSPLNSVIALAGLDNNCATKSIVKAFNIIIISKQLNKAHINSKLIVSNKDPNDKAPNKMLTKQCQIDTFSESTGRIAQGFLIY